MTPDEQLADRLSTVEAERDALRMAATDVHEWLRERAQLDLPTSAMAFLGAASRLRSALSRGEDPKP